MEFKQIKTPSLKDVFVNEIETMILSGELKIGEKLPSERELSEKMNVSRTVINNGISELAQKGFLNVEARSGVYVKDYRRYGSIEILVSIMNYREGNLPKDEITSILELKLVIDKLAVSKAIDFYQTKDIITLTNFLELLAEECGSEKCSKIIFDFYHEIAIISKNTLLPLIYSSFKIPVTHLWENYIEKCGKKSVYDNAFNILEAIKNNDKEKALTCIQKNMDTSMSKFLTMYEKK